LWLFPSGNKMLRVFGTRRCYGRCEKAGKGNTEWVVKLPGKIFVEAMQTRLRQKQQRLLACRNAACLSSNGL
jgi:hypothetical protein